SEITHRPLHPCQSRTHPSLLWLTHRFFRRLSTPRRFPQQMPPLPILFILRFAARGAQTNRLQPANQLRGNDVPCILGDDICRQKIERSRTVSLVILLDRTNVSFPVLHLC